MSQNDLVISNQTFPATRADINNALQALGSLNSGSTEPATKYANMMWYDTTTNILKMRSEANDAWISVGTLNQSNNTFSAAHSDHISLEGATQSWTFALSGDNLVIKYGATNLARIDTSGNLSVLGNVTAYGVVS